MTNKFLLEVRACAVRMVLGHDAEHPWPLGCDHVDRPFPYQEPVAKRTNPGKLLARAKRDLELQPEIERVLGENFVVYGSPKVWRQMLGEGVDAGRCRAERLMSDLGLQGVIRGKPIRTIVQDKAAPCPFDHVNRVFHVLTPN